MTYAKDLIQFRASVLFRGMALDKKWTTEMQNDYDFIMQFGSPELQELINEAKALFEGIDNLPYINERDKI